MSSRTFRSSYRMLCTLAAALTLAACPLTPPGTRAATPVISPAPGLYYGGQIKVTITCDDRSAVIYYTTNGAEPSQSSKVYRNDILIQGDADIRAIACAPGMADSEIAASAYTSTWATLGGPGSPTDPFTSGDPLGIALAPDGALYVTDSGGWIRRMDDLSGRNLKEYNFGVALGGIAVDSRGVYYSADSQIFRTDGIPPAGTMVYGTFGMGGPDPGYFNNPGGIAVSNGVIYVADSGNNRIVRFTDMTTGGDWITFGTSGTGDNQFNGPMGIAADADGRIYVADTENHRIVRLESDMSGWTAMGDVTHGDNAVGHFQHPRDIAVSGNYAIYVADTGNSRIVRLENMDAGTWQDFQGDISNPVGYPTGIAVDSTGFVYVADTGRVFRLYWP